MANIDAVVVAWIKHLDKVDDWQTLVRGVEPKQTGCGPVYELESHRKGESIAIADMRDLKFAEPHYHTGGETEIYFVLAGTGVVVVGGKEHKVEPGSVIVTPPETVHFTVPHSGLVLAAVNTPPFSPDNYKVLEASDPRVGYDQRQLVRLTAN